MSCEPHSAVDFSAMQCVQQADMVLLVLHSNSCSLSLVRQRSFGTYVMDWQHSLRGLSNKCS